MYKRIIEQTGPVSFKVRNQLTGEVTKTHARHLRIANVDEWELPKDNIGRPLRKSTYVVPPESSSEESEEETSLKRVIRYRRQERSDSDSGDDIPLMELRQRLRTRELDKASPIDSDDELIPLSQLKRKLKENNNADTQTDDDDDDFVDASETGGTADDKEIDAINKLANEVTPQISTAVDKTCQDDRLHNRKDVDSKNQTKKVKRDISRDSEDNSELFKKCLKYFLRDQ
ncbi:uncharacterized protein [Argopecten irradians]|uniref:uncharacterized protein n=1 Tax=Argopecten irradians TaxID=31199 RepID=UPI00372011CE